MSKSTLSQVLATFEENSAPLTMAQIARADLSYVEWLAGNWKWPQGREAAAAVLAHYQAQQPQPEHVEGAAPAEAYEPPF